ncbi:restriction endonuclease [Bradyrhizobium sp. RDI18]|uniref:restriction endonuclease n=1 Tax=Bradyrhizobium sp. RDI18 TaxID=3367400 RepID=UPI00372413F0
MAYNWASEHPVGALLIGAVIVAFGVGFLANYVHRKEEVGKAAKAIIQQHAKTLRRRRDQTVFFGAYQEVNIDKWMKEKEHFYRNVLVFSLPGATDPAALLKYESDKEFEAFCFDLIEDAIRNESATADDADDIVDPIDFERWCAEQLSAQEWDARTTKGSGDQGADVIAEREGFRVVLQCKLYSKAVGNKAVQEAYAAMQFEGADLACVVTNAAYTKAARALAGQTGVLLLHRDDLLDFDEVLEERDEPDELEDPVESDDEERPVEDTTVIFAREGERVMELVSSRPRLWAFLLVEELLRSRLSSLNDEAQDIERVRNRKSRRQYDLARYLDFSGKRLARLGVQSQRAEVCVTDDIPAALGPPGTPADPVRLLRAVETLEGYCLESLDFEIELARIEPPDAFRTVHESFRGIGATAVAVFEAFANKWSEALRGVEDGSREFDVHVKFELPQLTKAADELEKVNLST